MNELIIATITLDTYRRNNIQPLVVPQGDYGARVIRVTITEQGAPISVESTAAVSIVATRSGDDASLAFSGEANDDGTVTVPITQWMLDLPDDVVCHVVVTGNGYQYSTTSFLIEPQEKANPTDITQDDPRKDLVTEVLAGENSRKAAETERVSNENARIAAENARQLSENQRLTDENTRIANEQQRVSAESSRDATFNAWEEDIASLPNFDSRISRNSKRITNLEQGLIPDPFDTDDTIAYRKDVPENALPYAEVNKIGGMSRKCPNLIPYPYTFGSSNTVSGVTFTANSDGSITVNGTANAYIWRTISSVNIPVGTYNMSANSNAGSGIRGVYWYLYSSSENFTISQIAGSTITTNNQQYSVIMAIEVGITLNNVTFKPMLNSGSTKLPYEPYYAGLRDTKVTEVKSVGVNLLNPAWGSGSITSNGVTFIKNADGSITINGTATNDIFYDFIHDGSDILQPNASYYASLGSNFVADLQKAVFAVGYIANGERVYAIWGNDGVFTTPATFSDVTVRIRAYAGVVFDNITIYPIIAKSNAAIPYEPYVEHTLPIPAEVQALDGYGNGVNADCYNYIDLEKKQLVKRVGVVDMGKLTWGSNANVGGFQAEVLRMTKKPVAIISTQYSFGVSNFSWANFNSYPDKTVNVSGVSNFIYLKDSEYTDAATLKADLSGVMLYYELATPEVIDISNLITSDNLIGVEGNGTITFENEYGYAVPSEVTYQLKGVTA